VGSGDVRVLAEAFKAFRSGLILLLIGYLLFGISSVTLVFGLIGAFAGAMSGDVGAALAGLGGSLLFMVISAVVLLIGFVRLLRAGDLFKSYDPGLGKLSTALKLFIAGLVIIIISLVLLAVYTPLGLLLSAIAIPIAGILYLIGIILFGLFLMDLGKLKQKGLPVPDTFNIAGILYLIGIFISILQLVAIILAILAAGSAARSLEEMAQQGGGEGAAAGGAG